MHRVLSPTRRPISCLASNATPNNLKGIAQIRNADRAEAAEAAGAVEAAVEEEAVEVAVEAAVEAVAAPVGVLVGEPAAEAVAAPVGVVVVGVLAEEEEEEAVGEVGKEVIGMQPSFDGSSTTADPIPAVCRHHLGRRSLHRGLHRGQPQDQGRGRVDDSVDRRIWYKDSPGGRKDSTLWRNHGRSRS